MDGFRAFWALYPKRVGTGKAEEAWSKAIKVAPAQEILTALKTQLAYILRDDGAFVPNPATWLNQKRWRDEVPKAYWPRETEIRYYRDPEGRARAVRVPVDDDRQVTD